MSFLEKGFHHGSIRAAWWLQGDNSHNLSSRRYVKKGCSGAGGRTYLSGGWGASSSGGITAAQVLCGQGGEPVTMCTMYGQGFLKTLWLICTGGGVL